MEKYNIFLEGTRSAIEHFALQKANQGSYRVHILKPNVISKTSDVPWNKQDRKPYLSWEVWIWVIGIFLQWIHTSPPVWLKLIFLDDSVRVSAGRDENRINNIRLLKEKQT